jgi:hypothetical protein
VQQQAALQLQAAALQQRVHALRLLPLLPLPLRLRALRRRAALRQRAQVPPHAHLVPLPRQRHCRLHRRPQVSSHPP